MALFKKIHFLVRFVPPDEMLPAFAEIFAAAAASAEAAGLANEVREGGLSAEEDSTLLGFISEQQDDGEREGESGDIELEPEDDKDDEDCDVASMEGEDISDGGAEAAMRKRVEKSSRCIGQMDGTVGSIARISTTIIRDPYVDTLSLVEGALQHERLDIHSSGGGVAAGACETFEEFQEGEHEGEEEVKRGGAGIDLSSGTGEEGINDSEDEEGSGEGVVLSEAAVDQARRKARM